MITKRQMERFNKLKERDAKVMVSPEIRREELMARKAKVKQLDDVPLIPFNHIESEEQAKNEKEENKKKKTTRKINFKNLEF